jgi:hypothetical protein
LHVLVQQLIVDTKLCERGNIQILRFSLKSKFYIKKNVHNNGKNCLQKTKRTQNILTTLSVSYFQNINMAK